MIPAAAACPRLLRHLPLTSLSGGGGAACAAPYHGISVVVDGDVVEREASASGDLPAPLVSAELGGPIGSVHVSPAMQSAAAGGVERVQRALAYAARLGATDVVIDAGMLAGAASDGNHDEALRRVRDGLSELRFAAESAGVVLGWFPCGPLPGSAAAMRSFLDDFATPWLGAWLDLRGPRPVGGAAEWIITLTRRLRGMVVRLDGAGDEREVAEWRALGAALQTVRSAAAICVECGSPADAEQLCALFGISRGTCGAA